MGTVEDPRPLVRSSYDAIAPIYEEACAEITPADYRLEVLDTVLSGLAPASRVLELGCGSGFPVARRVVDAGHSLVGVDLSPGQLARARDRVPEAELIEGDFGEVAFDAGSFDAVLSFYAIFHLPREAHASLLARALSWLRPGGWLAINMGAGDDPGTVYPDYLGVPMYWSHYTADENADLVEAAGFELADARVRSQVEEGRTVYFVWLIARRPIDEPVSDGSSR